ncbi:MAG: LytTR family DNA-binding domain-containing protein [Bacteroidota bacterium]
MPSQNILTRLTAIIVDDELYGRENLRMIIENYCHEIEILGCADSVVSAKELVIAHTPDVVFLDINMPVLDGFDFLSEYDDRNFMVVFVSAHEEFGINAVKVGAVDYLLKPINIKELKQTVKNLLSLKSKKIKTEPVHESDKLVIPASHGFDLLAFDDLIRLEADGCYTKIVVKGEKNKIVCRTLKEFEDSLPKDRFFRIHKSHLINLKYLKDYSNFGGNYATMTDGSKVEISRRKAPEFIKRVKAMLNVV